MKPVAVYIHTPFCPSKCGYCDFNSYAMEGEIIPRTVDAICTEILASPWRGRPAKTIFFGGGTPTFLSGEQLVRILDATREVHPPVEGCEITSEANPGTADASKFAEMRSAGFNRISLGAQSFFDDDLLTLGRVHRASEIERAVTIARAAGFANLNLDLMFALPNQSKRAWERNLDRALALQPEHLSLYCLTIEQNTAFHKLQLKGQLPLPDDDDQAAMYEKCLDRLSDAGFLQYEISNFCLPGFECRHNLCYWYGEDYAGYGPGAVGAMDGKRGTNIKHPERYCEAIQQRRELHFECEVLTPSIQVVERTMLGLRLNEGLPDPGFSPEKLQKLLDRGWIEVREQRVLLTRAGRHFCSEVALELI